METETLCVDSTGDLGAATRRAAEVLGAGEVVALPSETVYGLAADATDATAVARIYAAKERPESDPLIVHIGRRSQLEEIAEVPGEIAEGLDKLLAQFWPGPLTVVLPKRDVIPDLVTAGLATVAVRLPEDRIFRAVLKAFGKPLAAPSANRFASISPTTARAVETELGGRIPLILDGGACSHGVESTIVKVLPPEKENGKFVVEVLRPGPLTKEDLRPFAKVKYSFRSVGRHEPAEAPGQSERHYAPRTPLELLDGPDDWVPRPEERVGLLCFKDDGPWRAAAGQTGTELARIELLSPGVGKLPEAMVRFYHCLRALDEAGLDRLVAEKLPERALGVTLNERLRRAAVE